MSQSSQSQGHWIQEETNDLPTSTDAVRRSTRVHKKKPPVTIDFANRAYRIHDGVLHISPDVLDQGREDSKITSKILSNPGRMALRSPCVAGISRQALNWMSSNALGLAAPVIDTSE